MDSSFSLHSICAAAEIKILGTLLYLLFMVVYKKVRSSPQKKTMASSPPPSDSSWGHHVFSSFSSVDVPITFLNRLWKELRRKGFDPFTDDEIERCVLIGPQLIKAISVSRIVIVILSRNYASSSRCLDELVEIIKCKEELGQRVVTVFYELDAIDVEKQTGGFGKIFKKTCKRSRTKEDIARWSRALAEVATIAGYYSSQWHYEAAMIENIATDISKFLNDSTQSSDFQGFVGMEAHMEKIEQMLCLDSDEVKTIGIWGPCGIGKTTIARFLYSKHSHKFDLSTIANVKAWARPAHNEYDAELQLQNQFLSQLLNHKYTDEIRHLEVAQKSLKDKKVLVVFDDVDSSGQLDALAKETLCLGPGSRIIITTEEPRILNTPWIQDIYKVDFPPPDEALQIFCLHVFGQKSPYDGFEKLARETTTLSGNYPLGLRFMGSYLRGVSLEYWKDELPRLRTYLDGEIGSIIKLTYDSLCGEDKELSHHHISCLRNGELTERMDEYLAKGVRQQGIIKNQDLKEDIYTSERVFEGMSNGLLHTVYIYCADTLQYSFASHLSMDFRRKGIYAFVNCNETLDVIKRVSASVVIFSKSCFYSTSDLDKLMRGFQCRRKTNQLVVPVFYGINPSDVVVPEHESADQIREWSSRLQELRELLGHQSREDCSERELVEEIVKDVYEKLFPTEQIGINSRLLEIEQLLRIQTWGIRHIGIWGMPGIGKTTLAKAFFDQISGGYEASCFIKHFDKAFHEKGLHCLLEEHFGKILRELPRACSSITRPSLPRDKLKKKRTLVVLDDVHNPLVAESFLGGFHWFAPGSLIIITSRDKQVFRLCQINHVYEVQSLNENEALQLFSHCAFLKDMSEQNLLKLSMEVIDYANGNPFALSFYGRELKGKKQSEMETTFLKFKLRTPYKIHDLFKSSYETLNDNEKNIFLDTACFFNGENVDYVMRLLEACGFFPHVGIDVLVEKCLVTISENRVKMHRIIQDFGREIINGETVQIERRSRLWEPWAIKFLLEDGEFKEIGDPKATYTHALATEDIEGISLDTSNLLFDVKPTAFENMLNLRFLKIYCSNYDDISGLRLPRGLESLPYELRLLHWENYPLQSLPQDFDSCHLVELNMSNSQLQKLWEGTKNTDRLKMVSLCHSQHLTQIDDICKAKNIELIDLQGCTRLQTFPATGQLQHLRVVNLSGCREIKSFPEVSPNIVELHLQGTGIRELPISIVTLSGQDKLHRELSSLLTEFSGVSNDLNLEKLTSGVQVVTSTQHLSKLVSLNMKDCVNLQSLPPMVDLESLKVLNMSGCSKLDDIQSFPRNLKELYLAGTAIKNLPQLPWSIEILNAHGCVSLRSIPFAFKQLPRYYTFSNCFALSALLIKCFVESTLTNVERIAREYQQEQKLNKSLASSFTVPSPASKKITFDMQSGSSVMVQLGSSWRNILGFAILVEVAFSEDYNEAGGFGISCICRWKDEECVSHRLEKNFNYWTTGEGVLKDHMFVFCDINMYQGTCEGNDSTILAELVVFEFFTVNKQGSLDESCTVTKCGVYVITAADRDTGPNVTQSFSSSDYLQELSDKETQDVLRVIHDGLDEKQRGLFLYMACLFNDEESDLLAPLIASNGLGISSGLKVLANKSLIHISPYGVIVRQVLLQKIGREIVCRQSTLPHRSPMLEIGFKKVSIDSSSPLSRKWKYDVFTSFSGEDDCNNKISNLLAEFEGKLISTLKNKMKRSKSVSPELVQAIRESRGSIVVLSKNYASSTRCLDELVEIMNCKKELAQKVVAIFYDVDPSDVRLQIGDFGRAFKTTCIGKSKDEKQKWVRALADLANITGLITRKWDDEENMIEKSGCHVSKKIDHTTSIDYAEVVRVEDHLTGISSLSSSESEDVKETFGISVSLEKGEEVTPGRVAMPVEPPYWFRQEGKLIRSEAWSPSFIDRLPFAELYSGEIPAAFLQGLGNIRSMLQSEKSK